MRGLRKENFGATGTAVIISRMAPRLGGVFATGALGPVHFAGQCILQKRVEQGLGELTVENLRGGLGRGVLQAAQLVGVGTKEIEGLLPHRDLEAILQRIAVSQPAVMAAWKMYAGGLGGLLTGVADLTVDGRAPDTALAVQRLAKKVTRDKPLSDPLAKLADDLFDWQDALHRCVELLNDTTALEQAYHRRRVRRTAFAVGLVALAVGALTGVVWMRVARAKVLAVIEKPDPCAAMDLTDGDLDRVSSDLRARAMDSRARCEAARAAEAKRIEEEKAREEREREAKKAQEALEKSCDALATHVESGALTPEDEALAKDAAPLLRRVAKGALDPSDYGPAEPALPCKGTKAEPRIASALTKAVLAKPWNLPKVEAPSKAVRDAIAGGAADLPPKLKAMMGTRAADAAKKAIATGKPDQIAHAIACCDVAKAMGTEPAGQCDGARSLRK